jgi:hypothetical protein
MPWAWALDLLKAGRSKAARMAMTAITTKSSIRVKALVRAPGLSLRFIDLIAASLTHNAF